MSKITLYGIKNCDTVQRARKWLTDNGIEYQFHDFREDGLEGQQLRAWLDELGLAMVNKRSTSWKALDPATREALAPDTASTLLLAHPTLIKRPLLDTGASRHVGFKSADYAKIFNQ